MAPSIHQLRALSDDELIAEHDKLAPYAGEGAPGLTYYLDELRRRDAERAEAASYKLSRQAYWLSVIGIVLATVSAIAAVIAIFIAG